MRQHGHSLCKETTCAERGKGSGRPCDTSVRMPNTKERGGEKGAVGGGKGVGVSDFMGALLRSRGKGWGSCKKKGDLNFLPKVRH